MSQVNPESVVGWLSFNCPLCKARLRIKEAYAHLRGRCPDCGGRIEALRPAPLPPPLPPSDSDQPLGLLPIEEEWPEPAQLDTGPDSYGLAPPVSKRTPLPPGRSRNELRSMRNKARLEATPPEVDPYVVLPSDVTVPPASLHLPAELVDELPLERRPRRRPRQHGLDLPLIEAAIFPLRRHTLAAWIFLSFDFLIVTELLTLAVLVPLIGPAVSAIAAMLCLPGALYAASCFFAVVESTAAGGDEVTWPEAGGLVDRWARLFHLCWVLACCALPIAILWEASRDAIWVGDLWWVLPLIMLLIFFPVLALSSLAASSRWLIFDRHMLAHMIVRPYVLPVTWLASTLLAIPCAAAIYTALLHPDFLWGAGLALLLATCLLIYARILGWAGRRLTREARGADKSSRLGARQVEIGGWGPDIEVEEEDTGGRNAEWLEMP